MPTPIDVYLIDFSGSAGQVQAGAVSTVVVSAIPRIYDRLLGGQGTLTGVVKRRVGDVDLPQMARVTVMEKRSKQVAAVVWSDAVTGVFAAPDLATDRLQFITLAEYPNTSTNPNAPDYLQPVAGVSPLD